MINLNSNSGENILYDRIIVLLQQVKLVQGGTALASTIRRHKKIRDFLMKKQKQRIEYIEDIYFLPDGSLDLLSVNELSQK